jgi:hypothetical protein
MKRLPLVTPRHIVITLTICCLGIGVTIASAAHSSSQSPDELAIEQVVTQAETAMLTLPYPYLGSAPADAAHYQSALARATSLLSSLYAASSPRLAVRLQQIRNAMPGPGVSSTNVLAAGIRNVNFQTVAISGTVATVHLTFTAYSRFTMRQPNGQIAQAAPTNDMIGDLSLIKTGQGWRITNEVLRFAPGSGP